MFDEERVRRDFPLLWRKVHAKPLVYLDNASTTQKPQAVIDAITNYYTHHNANIHRGVHQLSDESTQLWNQARAVVAGFFGAEEDELILTRNTTESMNGIAYGWADHNLTKGDVILVSYMDHHSNLVVWQEAAKRTGAKVVFVNLTAEGEVDLHDLKEKLAEGNVKLLTLTYVSNTLGSVCPLQEIITLVDEQVKKGKIKPRIVVDGAQAASHLPVDFSRLGVDFFSASGHKMLGPMGSGLLLVRKEILESGEMRPYFFGGGMIAAVSVEGTEFSSSLSDRFTPGTPDVASAVGLEAACNYLSALGMEAVLEHDQDLVAYALEQLQQIPEVELVGPLSVGSSSQPRRVGSVAFLYKGVHAHDVAQVLDSEGVAVRSGHHCTMPLHVYNDWVATTRASFQVYNTREEIDALVSALDKVKRIFKV